MGICYMAQGTQTGTLYQPRGVEWEGDGREVQEGEDKCEGDLVVTSVTPLIARVDSADLAG